MAETLAEFIARRRRELVESEARLRAQLLAIGQERHALEVAEHAEVSPKGKHSSEERKHSKRTIKPNTIMSDVLDILREHPRGLIALDILAELNKRRECPLLRTSLSPQLSRLKQSGYIDLRGSNWVLKTDDNPQLSDMEAI